MKDTPVDELQIRKEIQIRELELAWQESWKKEQEELKIAPQDIKQILAQTKNSDNQLSEFVLKAFVVSLSALLKDINRIGEKSSREAMDRLRELMTKLKAPLF